MIKTKPPKPKKCKACRETFQPASGLSPKVCGYKCAMELVKVDKKKANRKELKEFRAKNKSRSDHLKDAQKSFNAFIRERDKNLPCISCGKPANTETHLTGSGWDCGHYRSVGSAPELRFNEMNARKQCVKCNQYLGGNVVEYRNGLIKIISDSDIKWLEGYHKPQNLTIPDLIDIKSWYRERVKLI